jgi:hypothetical protein
MIPLPDPTYFTWTDYESKIHHQPYYTANQMHAYAAAAVAEEREQCAKLCEEYFTSAACAAAIRANGDSK